MSGDNLGSHLLGGYKAPSGALRKCRHCMATNVCDPFDLMLFSISCTSYSTFLKFVSDAFIQRTRQTHASHCRALDGPLRDHAATAYGLCRDSILNSSAYFHVTKGLAPDVMHDVLEGTAQYEVKELIKHLIEEKILSLNEFNQNLVNFLFSYVDIKDKPTPLIPTTLSSSDHSMKQKGTYIYMNVLEPVNDLFYFQ